jgi:hypothetical protein
MAQGGATRARWTTSEFPAQSYPITVDGFHRTRIAPGLKPMSRPHSRHASHHRIRSQRKTRNLRAVQKLLSHTDIRTAV